MEVGCAWLGFSEELSYKMYVDSSRMGLHWWSTSVVNFSMSFGEIIWHILSYSCSIREMPFFSIDIHGWERNLRFYVRTTNVEITLMKIDMLQSKYYTMEYTFCNLILLACAKIVQLFSYGGLSQHTQSLIHLLASFIRSWTYPNTRLNLACQSATYFKFQCLSTHSVGNCNLIIRYNNEYWLSKFTSEEE